MLKVGIHENLFIHKVTKNDKSQLVIGVKKAEEVDPLTALSSSGQSSFEPAEQDFIPYDIKVVNFGKVSTVKEMMGAIGEYKDPLELIASMFLTSDKRKWDPFVGTGITNANFNEKIVDQTVVSQIQYNINEQFINMMRPFVGDSSKKFRMIFIRQSQAKHYPKLRNRWLSSQPFIEPMDVPVSKIKFSEYEKNKGLDNPNPVGGATAPSKQEAEQAAELFAQ